MVNSSNQISDRSLNIFIWNVLDSFKLGMVVLNADYSINKMNLRFMNIFGYKHDDLHSKSIKILFNSDDYKDLQGYINHVENIKNASLAPKYELNGLRQDKNIIPLEISIFKNNEDQNNMLILIIQDISEFKQNVDDLKYLAYYDQLTQLPNRTLFRDRAEIALRTARRENGKFAIVYIDIDDFKVINDKMGHEAGDVFLKELSKRFQACVRDSDTVSRVGGDEFAILILKITCIEEASIVAERILASNLLPVRINDQNIVPKTSLGISIFPQDGDNIDILLKNADSAMYYVKENGKNQFMFYKQK